MAWSIFKTKTRRAEPPLNRTVPASSPRPLRQQQQQQQQQLACAVTSATRQLEPIFGKSPAIVEAAPVPPRPIARRPSLDPESNPLTGVNTAVQHAPLAVNPRYIRKKSSLHSVRSAAESTRSTRSGVALVRARQIKAAHAVKRAAVQYLEEHSHVELHCYCCGRKLTEIKCPNCRTTYLPPEYKFNAAVALLNESFGGGGLGVDHFAKPKDTSAAGVGGGSSAVSISDVSISSVSIAEGSITGAASFMGFYLESEDDFPDVGSQLDLELVEDLAQLQENTLLEAILFDSFSSCESIASIFYRPSEDHNGQSAPQSSGVRECQTELLNRISTRVPSQRSLSSSGSLVRGMASHPAPVSGISSFRACSSTTPPPSTNAKPIVDVAAVNRLYKLLVAAGSAGPMRGILQGAQCVLQTRQHAPISEAELAYICVILQCPAIIDCSMFTKITGPLQKLSRYAGLRARARTILEVCAGLVGNSEEYLHPRFCRVFAVLEEEQLAQMVDLCNAYVSHRLSFAFHSQTAGGNLGGPTKYKLVKHESYVDDWRMFSVVRLLALLWEANRIRQDDKTASSLPLNRFYNTMVDYVDLKSDFDAWQATRKFGRLSFCRYPFLLSMGAKATVLELSVQRIVYLALQREMFASMAVNRRRLSAQADIRPMRSFTLRVRRQHLLEDSLASLDDWSNVKRGFFKVEFEGEPGIDAGGPKREWFHMFFERLFAPELGVFKMDENSNYSWFANHPDLSYYRVAGRALGLALFNAVTVDLNLPLILFKLLLDAPYDLGDIGKLWPDIAQSLQSILDYDADDFEEVFGLTFTAPDGSDLIADGSEINVNLSNKDLYVGLLVDHLVNAQGAPFQAFKSAFLEMCGDNALILFQPEELELLTRGDRKPIDVKTLRSVTKYVNFGHRYEKANMEPVVVWFWDYFEKLDPASQARLFQFITATDRPPAAGMVQMRFSIMCLGGDSERLPISHTCFNELGLYRYKSRKKLEKKFSLAIKEFQGFGLK